MAFNLYITEKQISHREFIVVNYRRLADDTSRRKNKRRGCKNFKSNTRAAKNPSNWTTNTLLMYWWWCCLHNRKTYRIIKKVDRHSQQSARQSVETRRIPKNLKYLYYIVSSILFCIIFSVHFSILDVCTPYIVGALLPRSNCCICLGHFAQNFSYLF